MDNERLIASIAEFAASQHIDKATVIQMLRDVLYQLIEKKFGSNQHFDIVIDPKGRVEAWQIRTIVSDQETVTPGTIPLSQAKKIAQDFEEGEEVAETINLYETFGRRSVIEALQMLIRKKQLLEKNQLFAQYQRLIGEVITVEVLHQTNNNIIVVDDARNELLLPLHHKIPGERLNKGTTIQALVHQVDQKGNKVYVTLSRKSPLFPAKLLSQETPDIIDNIVTIRAVGRIAGKKTVIAVESNSDQVDAVGTCIGVRGHRIQNLSKKFLHNEPIKIIYYTPVIPVLIQRITGLTEPVTVHESARGSIVILGNIEQMALLHYNISFIRQMLEKPVCIIRNTVDAYRPDDVLLNEVGGIDQILLRQLRKEGFNTVRSILSTPQSLLTQQTNIASAVVEQLYLHLQKETQNAETANSPIHETEQNST